MNARPALRLVILPFFTRRSSTVMIVVYARGRACPTICRTSRTFPSWSDQSALRHNSSSGGSTSRGAFGISFPVWERKAGEPASVYRRMRNLVSVRTADESWQLPAWQTERREQSAFPAEACPAEFCLAAEFYLAEVCPFASSRAGSRQADLAQDGSAAPLHSAEPHSSEPP